MRNVVGTECFPALTSHLACQVPKTLAVVIFEILESERGRR
jgi:hypothetical protein